MDEATQAVVQHRAKLQACREALTPAFKKLKSLKEPSLSPQDKRELMTEVHAVATAYFNAFEELIGIFRLVEKDNAPWETSMADEALGVLNLIEDYQRTIKPYKEELKLPPTFCQPVTGAFASMQRLVADYYPEQAKEWSAKFQACGLSVMGFEQTYRQNQNVKAAMNKPTVPKWFPVAGFISLACVIIFFMAIVLLGISGHPIPDNGKFPAIIVLAISSGLMVTFLGGTIIAKGQIPWEAAQAKPVAFSASGGIAALIVILILGKLLW